MNPVEQFFTRRFMTLYGAPDTKDPAAFVAEYNKALAGTDDDILQAASDLVVRQHTFRNWPTVGECVEAVGIVATRRAAAEARSTPPWFTPRTTHSAESRARIAALVNETLAALKTMNPKPRIEPFDWSRTSKPAWEKRMRESPTARWMSLPQDTRDDILGVKPKR